MTEAEYLFFNAVRGAIAFDELKSTEGVIRALRPQIPYLGDDAIGAILGTVTRYIEQGTMGVIDAHFISEWADVRAWLTEEKMIREEIRKHEGKRTEGEKAAKAGRD